MLRSDTLPCLSKEPWRAPLSVSFWARHFIIRILFNNHKRLQSFVYSGVFMWSKINYYCFLKPRKRTKDWDRYNGELVIKERNHCLNLIFIWTKRRVKQAEWEKEAGKVYSFSRLIDVYIARLESFRSVVFFPTARWKGFWRCSKDI